MNKKAKNQFDTFVESLSEKFSKITNFELLSESDETKRISNYLVQTIIELNSIKSLFIGLYIPQTNKFIYESKQEFKKSKYSKFIKIEDDLWKSETNELVRIGYVTLFHKYESFASKIFPLIDDNYIKFQDSSISLKQYALKEFDLKIDEEWFLNSFLKKLNWICNCQKHNDGFPQTTKSFYKDNSLNKYLYPEFEKIKVPPDNLKNDIEFMVEFVQVLFQNVMSIALFRMAEESSTNSDDMDDEFKKEQNEKLVEAKEKVKTLTILSKQF